MSVYERYSAVFLITAAIYLATPPNAAAAEKLERVFVGVPNQLTLPPNFPSLISGSRDCSALEGGHERCVDKSTNQPSSSRSSEERSLLWDDEEPSLEPNQKQGGNNAATVSDDATKALP